VHHEFYQYRKLFKQTNWNGFGDDSLKGSTTAGPSHNKLLNTDSLIQFTGRDQFYFILFING